jgi:hypothetical protein
MYQIDGCYTRMNEKEVNTYKELIPVIRGYADTFEKTDMLDEWIEACETLEAINHIAITGISGEIRVKTKHIRKVFNFINKYLGE